MTEDCNRNVPSAQCFLMEEKLDAALRATFPASDPFSLTVTGGSDSKGGYASPPCLMHELSEGNFGYLRAPEVVALLNELLEGERAGARAVARIARSGPDALETTALHDIARDEARFVAMLTRHVSRLGGTPSTRTGAYFGKLIAAEGMEAQIDLLNRGQGWVVHKLRSALPRIDDDELHRDLKHMLEAHEQNFRRFTKLD